MVYLAAAGGALHFRSAGGRAWRCKGRASSRASGEHCGDAGVACQVPELEVIDCRIPGVAGRPKAHAGVPERAGRLRRIAALVDAVAASQILPPTRDAAWTCRSQPATGAPSPRTSGEYWHERQRASLHSTRVLIEASAAWVRRHDASPRAKTRDAQARPADGCARAPTRAGLSGSTNGEVCRRPCLLARPRWRATKRRGPSVAAAQERRPPAWCGQRLRELDSRPSLFIALVRGQLRNRRCCRLRGDGGTWASWSRPSARSRRTSTSTCAGCRRRLRSARSSR